MGADDLAVGNRPERPVLGDSARGLDPTSPTFVVLRYGTKVVQESRVWVDRGGLATDMGVVIELLNEFVSIRCRSTVIRSAPADRSLVAGDVFPQFSRPAFKAVEAIGEIDHISTGARDR